MFAGRPCIVLQSEIWDPRKQKQRETVVALPGRDWWTAVPTRRWPWTRSRHFPASPRPAPPRPAGTQSSSPHRQSDPPASSPFSSSLAPALFTFKVYSGPGPAAEESHDCLPRDAAPREAVYREDGGAGAPNAVLSALAELEMALCPPSQVPRAAPEKREGWAVPRRMELGSSAELGRD